MSIYTDTDKFLQAVFPDHQKHAIFADSAIAGGMHHCRAPRRAFRHTRLLLVGGEFPG